MNTNSENTSTEPSCTMATILEAMAKLPPPPRWKACVLSPSCLAKMRTQANTNQPQFGILGAMGGLPFHTKQGQVADAWMFADEKLLRDYLGGKLSETHLFGIIASGRCALGK